MILKREEDTGHVAAALARKSKGGDVITLSGPLGVGKTAFARGFIKGLGYDGDVPSPSFSLVQPYDDLDPPVWHADLFRIEDSAEIDELGLDCAPGAVLLVEWPDRAEIGAWPEALALSLEFGESDERILTATVPPSWEGRWPFR